MTQRLVLRRPVNGIGIICVEMKVLFVASGNHGELSPIVKSQGDSLAKIGIEIDYFLIKGKGIRGYLDQIRPLRRYCQENRFDVIHAHFSYSAYVVSLAGGKPIVVSLMGDDVKASKLNGMLIRICSKAFCWKEMIVKSDDMSRALNIGRSVQVVPNGVDLEMFIQMEKEVCMRHLGWKNGVKHVLFPANPERKVKDFPLAQGVVNKLGGMVELHVFNNVEQRETVWYYNAADAVLLTSIWEGSPNVIKEALACGCPIVSVNVGDVKERLEGVEGCYVANTRDPEELATLLDMALAFEKKTKGREKIIEDKLDSKQVAKQLKSIYEKICA